MSKLKVLTIVGTRPEVIRLSRVINNLDKNLDNVLVHTGQNYDYELNQIFFEDLGIRQPDYYLNSSGSNSTKTIGNILISVDNILEKLNPEALLVLGDTNRFSILLGETNVHVHNHQREPGRRAGQDRLRRRHRR